MSSHRESTNDVENRKLKRKIPEEPFTLKEKDAVQQLLCLKRGKSTTMNESSKSCRVSSEEGSKPVLQSYKNMLCCRFCNKKFPNFQSLGGHQKAHKNARQKLKMFGPGNNVNQNRDSFYHGAHKMQPMTQNPNLGFYLTPHNFGMTSSLSGEVATSQWRLNIQSVWQQIHSHSGSALNRSSSTVDDADLHGRPSMQTTEDSPSADLDLSLKL